MVDSQVAQRCSCWQRGKSCSRWKPRAVPRRGERTTRERAEGWQLLFEGQTTETWNAGRLIAQASHVEHWLNGVKVVEYELWSPEWEELVSASKWDTLPGYGRQRRGHIALQDHGDWVAYRNIKIRPLR